VQVEEEHQDAFWVSAHRGWATAPEVDDENQGWKKVQQ
jgi:hypothetical protein